MLPSTTKILEGRNGQEVKQRHLGIVLDDSADLEETIRQVEILSNTSSSSIEKVDVYIEHSFFRVKNTTTTNTTSSSLLIQLMEAIGSLPNLTCLGIRSLAYSDGRFVRIPRRALESVLVNSSNKLKRLELSHLDFTTTTTTDVTPPTKNLVNESRREESAAETRATSNNSRCSSCPCPLLTVMQLLEKNNNNNAFNLKELNLNLGGYRKISKTTQSAVVTWLQHRNFCLEHLHLDVKTQKQFSASKRKRIQFYLDLNQDGMRQKLLLGSGGGSSTNPPTSPTVLSGHCTHDHDHHRRQRQQEEWEDAVIANRHHSSTVFYLLSNNPTMISCV